MEPGMSEPEAAPGWLERDRWLQALWRLPVWGSLAGLLERLGGARLAPVPIPPLPAGCGPLDALEPAGSTGLRAGAAAVDITPEHPEGVCLAGFASNRRCSAVRDPLYARVLVLSDGGPPLVIAALDLIGLSLGRSRRIRRLISRRWPERVLLVCTHNHQGPDTMGLWGRSLFDVLPLRSGFEEAVLAGIERGLLQAVAGALADMRPAQLKLAAGEFDRAGRWVRNERARLRDTRLRVLHLTDRRGAAIATLAQHACHPETLWQDNRRLSADYCAVCCRTVEGALGGVGLYVNGALGAMVTAALEADAPASRREPFVDDLGRALGRAAVRLVRRRARPVERPTVDVALAPVTLPADDNRLYRLMHALGVVEQRDLSRGLESEVALARIGPARLLGLPGEPAPALGLELLARLDGQPRFLLGLCNDELGYLLPPEYFHDPRYAYEQMMNPGPQAALRLSLAVQSLGDRLGAPVASSRTSALYHS
jgi:hypothetical protein